MYSNVNIVFNKIFFSYFKDGKRVDASTEFNPSLYIVDGKGGYRGDDGKELKKIVVSLKDYFNLTNSENRKNYYYGEISPVYQFISKIWKEFKFTSKHFKWLKVFALDIEVLSYNNNRVPDVNKAEYEISSISIKDFNKELMYVLSFLPYDKNKSVLGIDKEKIIYKKCENEIELLKGIVYILEHAKPDILTGWNIEFFDLPYIYNRIINILGENELKKCSPYHVLKKVIKRNYNDLVTYKDPLIPFFDYLSLYRAYTENKRVLDLNQVSSQELELEKISYNGNLAELAKNDPQKYVDYNIWDTELVYRIDKKMKLIELALNIMYRAKVVHKDVFHATQLWDVLIYNELKNQNKVIIPWPVLDTFDRIKGAHVFESKIGKHDWINVYDVGSMYPNVTIGANISKMSLIENVNNELMQFRNSNDRNIDSILNGEYKDLKKLLEKYDYCYTPNGQYWDRKEQSVISKIMEDIYNERKDVQQRMKTSKNEDNKSSLDAYQYALKILLNSGYGVFACEYFRYKDTRVGEAITSTGQLIIKAVYEEINKKLSNDVYIVGGDTDSIFLSLSPYVNKLNLKDKNDKINAIIKYSNEHIVKILNSVFGDISNKLNFSKFPLKMKLEYIADKGLYRAKKNYIVRKVTNGDVILDKEKISPKGIEIIKSSIPFVMRKRLNEFLSLILNDDMVELEKKISELKKEFRTLPLENIALSKTTTDITKYYCGLNDKLYEKSTPIHIRAAILYNYLIEKNKLNLKKAVDNGRIYYVHMLLPNIINENVMGFVESSLFDSLKIKDMIDYDLQFEKLILHPLTKLTTFYNKDLVKDKSSQLVDISALFDY